MFVSIVVFVFESDCTLVRMLVFHVKARSSRRGGVCVNVRVSVCDRIRIFGKICVLDWFGLLDASAARGLGL